MAQAMGRPEGSPPGGREQAPVSVVIPTYNSGRFVTCAIDSVLAQTTPPSQIVVVDDGSRDDTGERLAAYHGRVHYVRQANQGVSAARNRGVREATGEFVAFLDADDVWHPRKLELQMEAFARDPELGLVAADSFDWPARAFPEVNAPGPLPVEVVPWGRLVVRNYLGASSVVVRRALLERAGPFDAALQGPEDRDLWLRVAELAPVAVLRLPLMGYRMVPGSVSKQAARCEAGMRRILEKVGERRGWKGEWLLRRKARGYLSHSCAFIYDAAGKRGAALVKMLESFAWYPLPYRRSEVQVSLERPKRLAVILLRLLGLKGPDRPRGPTLDDGEAAPFAPSGGSGAAAHSPEGEGRPADALAAEVLRASGA
jgi:glycosyltransferase involved in cell wall biosynthesis